MLFGGWALSGFICIEPEGYAADDALASWVQRGLDFVSRRSRSARAADPFGPRQADMTTLGPRPAQQELRSRSLHSERQKSALRVGRAKPLAVIG